jgi:hypothetical protein
MLYAPCAKQAWSNVIPIDAMSALGQKQTPDRPLMSALPPKADIAERDYDVRKVPKADINHFCCEP